MRHSEHRGFQIRFPAAMIRVDDGSFLWIVHFRHSLFSQLPAQSGPTQKGANMTIPQYNAGASGQNELLSTLPFPQLPKEPRAHVAILSPAKRNALIACFHASALNKKDGAWHGLPDSKRTSGVTVADLARDGMLTLTTDRREASARLTERGNWFARTLLCDENAKGSEMTARVRA